jgi:tol-pal system protein YbgF
MERMDRLERDIMLLQRQLARGEPLPAAATANLAPLTEEEIAASGGPASLDVRLSNMEDEMRVLRGKVEEVEFQNRKLAENFEKFQKDTEFRFGELQGGAPMSDPAAATGSATERKPLAENGDVPASGTTAGDGVLRPPSTQTGDDYATPRDHYNHAFKLLQQTKYDDAAKTFEGFIKKHPKDPLVGNAYYWLGETHYIRRDYVAAADNFRQGFEVLPNGHKAGDNLLKLAMSLNALQRDKEACVVLGQVVTKYKKSSVSITEKAHQEQKRIGCK